MRKGIAFSLIFLSFIALGVPKQGEVHKYKIGVKISSQDKSGNSFQQVMEFVTTQKVQRVEKDGSYIINLTIQQTKPPSTQKSPSTYNLKVDKAGNVSLLDQGKHLPLPPQYLGFLFRGVSFPPNFKKGSIWKLTPPGSKAPSLTFKHMGDSSIKGVRCFRVSLSSPKTTNKTSSPQGEVATTFQMGGDLIFSYKDNMLMKGNLSVAMSSKGYMVGSENKKIPIEGKTSISVSIERL